MLNYNVKFLTYDDSIQSKNVDFNSFKYEIKKRIEESVYDTSKRKYCERRGGHWRPPQPRQIKQLEAKLQDHTVLLCEWTSDTLVTLIFSSGVIAYLAFKPDTLDLIQILYDRYCVAKLSGQVITGVILCSSHLMFTHADRSATLITFGKTVTTDIPCRISDREPHVQTVELGGGARRSERKISWCANKGGLRVLVWSTSTTEPAPWSPVVEDHANLHLYFITGQQISLAAYHQLENETLVAEMSIKYECSIHIVEQLTCHKNGINLIWIRYEVPIGEDMVTRLSSVRESNINVILPAPARTVKRSGCELKLLTACIDGSIHIIHSRVGLTHNVRVGFIATDVQWAGDLIIAAEEGGRVQCFDHALSLLHYHTKCFDLTMYLSEPKRMQIMTSRSAKGGPILLISFSGGPLALLHISHPRLLTAWLRSGRSSNAVALLRAMDWDENGMECLWAVNKLVCAALRSGPDALSEEGCAQAALGAYLAPPVPVPSRFAPPVHDLARKFFHHLLRRGRVEKALSLAVDLRAWDLFTDARWAAEALHQPHLAQEALELARETHDSECSESCSQCSSNSYTDEEEISEKKRKPPPLPRVSLPTIMPVAVAHNDYSSTNSIRPNLHQYLDREDTIWNTDAEGTYVRISAPDKIKPILDQSVKWTDDNLSARIGSLSTLSVINEVPAIDNSMVDTKSKPQQLCQLRNVYRAKLSNEPRNVIRIQDNHKNSNHIYKLTVDRASRTSEKNKVKFSDTVTIAVVSEPPPTQENARELAASLPLCPPHKYLEAFAPRPQNGSAGTAGKQYHSQQTYNLHETPKVQTKMKLQDSFNTLQTYNSQQSYNTQQSYNLQQSYNSQSNYNPSNPQRVQPAPGTTLDYVEV